MEVVAAITDITFGCKPRSRMAWATSCMSTSGEGFSSSSSCLQHPQQSGVHAAKQINAMPSSTVAVMSSAAHRQTADLGLTHMERCFLATRCKMCCDTACSQTRQQTATTSDAGWCALVCQRGAPHSTLMCSPVTSSSESALVPAEPWSLSSCCSVAAPWRGSCDAAPASAKAGKAEEGAVTPPGAAERPVKRCCSVATLTLVGVMVA